jgi:hypothetical protein
MCVLSTFRGLAAQICNAEFYLNKEVSDGGIWIMYVCSATLAIGITRVSFVTRRPF